MRTLLTRVCLIGSIFCAGGLPVAGQGAKSPFTVAKETTYYTAPVRTDGTIDYVEAVNNRLSRGVTPENNAAIPLLEAVPRPGAVQVDHYNQVRKRLGMPALTAGARPAADADDFGGAEPKEFDQTAEGPWTADAAPAVAAYLAGLDARLNKVAEAAGRDQYYMPMVRTRDGDPMGLVWLPHLVEVRTLMNALRSRAMLRLGNEDAAGFRRDVITIVRLGRLVGRGPMLVEKLVGGGCEDAGLYAVRVAAGGGWLSAGDVDALRADLRAAPPTTPIDDALDVGRRLFVLEVLQAAAAHGRERALAALDANGTTGVKLPAFDPATIDWDAALRRANGWADRLRDAGRKPAYAARVAAVEQLLGDAAGGGTGSLEDRVLAIVLPSAVPLRPFMTETRLAAHRELTETVLALSSFRSKTGEFPVALRELVPAYLAREPLDPFGDRPLTYRRAGAGYALMSTGPDGTEKTAEKNDLVIRVER